jgi:flagellar L-ring protein precursor FlgH
MSWRFRPAVVLASLLALCAAGRAEPGSDRHWALARRLYGDTKAKHIGDILTVIIDEKAQSAKDAKGSSSKNTAIGGDMSMGHPVIDARATVWTNAAIPAWKLNAVRSFDGAGSTENNDKFVTTMSVTVRDVLPNGNLLVEGSRSVVIRDDTVNLVLSGAVRPHDITAENTISSAQIADAVIRYQSTGGVARNQDRGAVTKILDWINPF